MSSGDVGLTPSEHVALAPFSTLGVGGAARWFMTATRVEDVGAAHHWCRERGIPLFVLGGGSNLVIADDGFAGLVLRVSLKGVDVAEARHEALVTAGAGEAWDSVVDVIVAAGLSGVEALSGIPGTVGGTPIQNVGAYGQEVSHVIDRVTVFDRSQSRMDEFARDACHFGYRSSRFKHADAGRFIVCGVTFRLTAAPPAVAYEDVARELRDQRRVRPSVRDVRAAVLAVRRRKGMVIDAADPDTRSVGSFFVNPVLRPDAGGEIARLAGEAVPTHPAGDGRVKVSAAWLIERSGFARAHVDGAVGLSSKHPLAIINRGRASAGDVLRLAARIKRSVVDTFGIWLRPEPVFVGLDENPEVEFLQRAHG